MLKLIIHNIFVFTLPFAGWGFTENWKKIALLVIYLFIFLVTMVATRWIASPFGVFAIFGHLCLLLALAILIGLRATPRTMKRYALSALISICSMLVLAGSFEYRRILMGIDVFIIPSLSMTPTLQPGDIILVDLLAYKTEKPNVGDVIVFNRKNDVAYVKRVSRVFSNDFLAHGDNLDHSISESALGEIPMAKIIGRVDCVLLNVRNPMEMSRILNGTHLRLH